MAHPRRFLTVIFACVACLAARAEPVRVVSQTVGTDELLLAVATPEQIAALSHLSRDPVFSGVAREAAAYPAIGHGDAETILRYRPTLVLFSDYSRAELVEQVRRAGVPVVVFDRYLTLEDAYANLRRLAAALGDPAAVARAETVIADCRARLARLQERLAGATPVRVIAPSTYGVIAGAGTTFQDICDHAGAENLATTLGRLQGHDTPPGEAMLLWPVETVVLGGSNLDEALAPYLKLPPYAHFPAVRKRRVALLDAWALGCVTHLRVHAYEQLARQLHPGRFRDPVP
ncbi:MAG: ABC transporter substrate-binding protein [Opitutaceae bacterium]|nr:ABC transporter substrate-binding protein [Opitutaceae bacterium]